MQLKNGTELQGGRYRIEKILGQGGFGITYLAEQTGLGRKVAIKEFFMKEFCNRNAETSQVSVGSKGSSELVERFREKFLKEARRIASLEHKNIVPVIDVFEENGTAYYVMKYMGGGSLSDKVAAGALPEADAVRYIRQIASALDFVHGKLMMHLDVKPANVLLSDDDEAVLIDFGLAKQYDDAGTQTSTTPVGISHGYAPMEQYKRGGVDTFSPATDIYSLGATLYKLVTGITPPEANDVANDGLPELPQHLSSNVRAAIEAAMQFRLKERPQSIGEFLEIIESGKVRDESGKWRDERGENRDDIVQGTNEGNSEVTFAFRDKPSTSTIERSTEETHLAGAVISSDSEKSQFSGSCHPERSEPSVDARRGQSQGSYKHANREILPPSGRQNDNSGKWKDESGEMKDERKGLGGTSKKKWAIIIAVLVIGVVAALLGTMSGGDSDNTIAERKLPETIDEEQRMESERLAAEQRTKEIVAPRTDALYFTANGIPFNMVNVEGGTFEMGATSEQYNPDDDEKPVHNVTLNDYYIGETEVTQSLWQAVMGTPAPSFIGDRNPICPVMSISYDECIVFINKLNSLLYNQLPTGRKFRLPTEAEWEFAARGGNRSRGYQYSGSDNIDDVAWCMDNSETTHPVKQKQANELGLYDMSGNVWEWCNDWYGSYSSSHTNPNGPSSGYSRVVRGGSWYNCDIQECRVASREYSPSDYCRRNPCGLRLAL